MKYFSLFSLIIQLLTKIDLDMILSTEKNLLRDETMQQTLRLRLQLVTLVPLKSDRLLGENSQRVT